MVYFKQFLNPMVLGIHIMIANKLGMYIMKYAGVMYSAARSTNYDMMQAFGDAGVTAPSARRTVTPSAYVVAKINQ